MSEITLIEEPHSYVHDGVKWPGITDSITRALRSENPFYTEDGRERGDNVHLATRYEDEGFLNLSWFPPYVEPYVLGYRQFKADTGFIPEIIEMPLHSHVYRFACTVDRVGAVGARIWIVEIKTGPPVKKHGVDPWAIQTAGQELCLPPGKYERFALQLKPNGKYKLHPHTDRTDRQKAISCIHVAHLQKEFNNGNGTGS